MQAQVIFLHVSIKFVLSPVCLLVVFFCCLLCPYLLVLSYLTLRSHLLWAEDKPAWSLYGVLQEGVFADGLDSLNVVTLFSEPDLCFVDSYNSCNLLPLAYVRIW